jgi:CRISPR-associated protein Cmr6
MEKGKLKVSNRLVGKVKVGKKEYSVPRKYDLAPRERYNNKDCEIVLEGSAITKVLVDGKELPENKELLEEIEADEIRKQERKEQEAFKAEWKGLIEKQERGTDSFVLNKAKLPKDTMEECLLDDSDNFSLKLNKLSRFDDIDNKFKFFQKGKYDIDFAIQANFSSIDFQKIAQQQKEVAEVICNVEVQNFKPDWRLVVGLGGASVYETSMTLHHIYGFPYIPASSVKGVVRSWIITECFMAQVPEDADKRGEKAEKKALQEKVFCDIFGCPSESFYNEARRGIVTFFDAFPTEPPKIEVDIMTPHYKEYYGHEVGTSKFKPPTDTQDPNPIPFLTVANTPFQFIIGSRSLKLSEEKNKIGGKTISEWLKDALENHGIGAKTAVGYGYMTSE